MPRCADPAEGPLNHARRARRRAQGTHHAHVFGLDVRQQGPAGAGLSWHEEWRQCLSVCARCRVRLGPANVRAPDLQSAVEREPAIQIGATPQGQEVTDMPVTFDRKLYFDSVRPSLFAGKMNQQQVDGQNAILSEWEDEQPAEDLRWLAYPLATTLHETASTMWPIEEYGK